MKANELMVGDWVYNKHHGKNLRLTPYDFFTHTHDEFGEQRLLPFAKPTFGLDLEPIPLTAEILSKCGFKKNKTGQWVIEKKHSIGCCGQTCDNTNPLEYAVWWDAYMLGCISYLEKGGNVTLYGTTYVHQLQQILRLFDLDNFIKIEL